MKHTTLFSAISLDLPSISLLTLSVAIFFTATPKHSATIAKPGMNMPEVYGNVICQVGAPELVEGGYILPPKVVVKQLPMISSGKQAHCRSVMQRIFWRLSRITLWIRFLSVLVLPSRLCV